tara:strand:+ start:22 stop:186 length:165 start_codon:yes stop_codon:yes gene_type:complete
VEMLMKTFKDFCLEAKKEKKKYHLKFAPIDMNYRKYNMPTAPRGDYKPPKTVDV